MTHFLSGLICPEGQGDKIAHKIKYFLFDLIYSLKNIETLKDKVVSQNKSLVDKTGNNENYSEETGDTIEMLGCVELVLTRLENVPKNKFRKAFEEEMEKKMIEEIKEMMRGKQALYWGVYDETDL